MLLTNSSHAFCLIVVRETEEKFSRKYRIALVECSPRAELTHQASDLAGRAWSLAGLCDFTPLRVRVQFPSTLNSASPGAKA